MDFGNKLDLILAKADALRKVGVRKLSIGDVHVELDPVESQLPEGLQKLLNEQNNEQGESENPLEDPSTYGLPPGAVLPGFKRLIDKKARE